MPSRFFWQELKIIFVAECRFYYFIIDTSLAPLHLLSMIATQTQTTQTVKRPGRWFFCAIVKESDTLKRGGTSAARRLADGRYEVHSAGKKSILSSQDAALHLKSERARGEVMYLNATEVADVDGGRWQVGSN